LLKGYLTLKMAKKTKKTEKTCAPCPQGHGCCGGIMAILIIVLTWLPSMTRTWSKVVVTIAAALMLLGSKAHMMKK
jgi:hypothetical protein